VTRSGCAASSKRSGIGSDNTQCRRSGDSPDLSYCRVQSENCTSD
jgi:hypothetical protein